MPSNATGTSVKGFQQLLSYSAADPFIAVTCGPTTRSTIKKYGYVKVTRYNGSYWVQVAGRSLWTGGTWLQTPTTASGTHFVEVIWLEAGVNWAAYSGPFV